MSQNKGNTAPDWSTILVDAVTKPGVISDAYHRFWNYSVGNQLLAMFECLSRGIEPGPLNTFAGWQKCGRNVKRGEKALTLCMPISVKKKAKTRGAESVSADADVEPDSEVITFTHFTYKNRWFVLSQTEGDAYVPPELSEWNEARALAALGVERIGFAHTNGNAQGYARDRQIAVSPIAFMPHRTLFHELAHVVLGHTKEGMGLVDGEENTPRDVREVEAECVALICCQSLGLGGEEFSRGYIQHWLSGNTIAERSVQRVFKSADAILKAGRAPIGREQAFVQ